MDWSFSDAPPVPTCKGSSCGDALANFLNEGPLQGTGYSLPKGGIGPGELENVGKNIGSPVYSKKDLSAENITPGMVIHMTRQPGDRNYQAGSTHIGIVDADDQGSLVFRSYTAGKGWRAEPISEKFINTLPSKVTATIMPDFETRAGKIAATIPGATGGRWQFSDTPPSKTSQGQWQFSDTPPGKTPSAVAVAPTPTPAGTALPQPPMMTGFAHPQLNIPQPRQMQTQVPPGEEARLMGQAVAPPMTDEANRQLLEGRPGSIDPRAVAAATKEAGVTLTPERPVMQKQEFGVPPIPAGMKFTRAYDKKEVPFEELHPMEQSEINQRFIAQQFGRGLEKGATMGAVSPGAAPVGTEWARKSGEFVGQLAPLTVAFLLGGPALEAAFPTAGLTEAGLAAHRVATAGVAGGAVGAFEKAINQAKKGEPANFQNLLKLGDAGAQAAANLMAIDVGFQGIGAISKTAKDYYFSKDVSATQKGQVINQFYEDMGDKYKELHPDFKGEPDPYILREWWKGLTDEQRAYHGQDFESIQTLRDAALKRGELPKSPIMVGAEAEAIPRETTPTPEPKPVEPLRLEEGQPRLLEAPETPPTPPKPEARAIAPVEEVAAEGAGGVSEGKGGRGTPFQYDPEGYAPASHEIPPNEQGVYRDAEGWWRKQGSDQKFELKGEAEKGESIERFKYLNPETASKNGMIWVARDKSGNIDFERSGKLYKKSGNQFYIGGDDAIKAKELMTFKGKIEAISEKEFADLTPPAAEKGREALPEGVKDFMGKYGTARGVGKPEGLLTQEKGKGVYFQRAIERNDLASLVHNLGGITPESVKDYISTPEERQALGRLILNKGGFPIDVMLPELKAHFPDQFGHFDADDLVRYFLDGRHKRALNQGSLEKQIGDYYADIEDEAKRRGVSPEGLAELEADVEREIATERKAIRSEGSAGEVDTSWELEPALVGGKPKSSKIESRLDTLEAEYPGIDREKAATVIRALPNAENGQIANMVADPDLFSQVARGNLAASEKTQLLKKATDAGAQMGLPGLTEPGRLFRVPQGGTSYAPGRQGAADTLPQREDRGEYLARDEERLRGELGGFQSRIRGKHDGAEERFWQHEIEISPEVHASPAFQAIVARAKAAGIDDIYPIKPNPSIEGCWYPEPSGHTSLFVTDPLSQATIDQIADHEIFHHRKAMKDPAALRLYNLVNRDSLPFKRYRMALDVMYANRDLDRLSNDGVAEEIAGNMAARLEGLPNLGIDFNDAFGSKADLQEALEDYRGSGEGYGEIEGTPTRKFAIFDEEGKRVAGTKNAVTEEERLQRGLDPVQRQILEIEPAMKEAQRRVDAGEDIRETARQIAKHPRVMSDVEDAMLKYDRMRLYNDHLDTMNRLDEALKSGDAAKILENRQRLARIEDSIETSEIALKHAGTQWSASGRMRQYLIKEDYSLARTVQRLRVAAGLKQIPAELREKIENLTKELKEAQAKSTEYEERLSKLEAERAASGVAKKVGMTRGQRVTGQKRQALDTEFKSLADRLHDKLSRLHMMFDPEEVLIMAEMFKNRIQAGVMDARAAVKAIYEELSDIPDLTERDVRDAVSGYGKIAKLSQEEINIQLREAKRHLRLYSALEDAQARKVPLRSGPQRDEVTAKVRELMKQVKQAMRESGIDSASQKSPEERWKTSLDAVKTRLRNQIFDLTKQIALRAKAPKKVGIAYDKEATDLKAERDRLQKALEEIVGKPQMSPEQRIRVALNAVKASITEYERRIKVKELAPKQRASQTPETPELKILRDRRDKLRSQYQQMQRDAKPKIDPMDTALKAFKTRTANRIMELEQMLATGQFEKRARRVLKMDPEAMRLKAKVEKLKEKIDDEVFKQNLANRNKLEKTLDWGTKWRRAIILSGLTTVAKLTAAAMMRQVSTPMEEVMGTFIELLPYFGRIMEMSPREGGGLNVRAEAAAFRQWFEKQTYKDILETAKTGKSELDRLYGKHKGHPPTWMDIFGHIHGALKVMPKRAEFYRSLQKRTEWAMRHGIDMSEPVNVMAIAAAAYQDALKAIFMQDNVVTDVYRVAINFMKQKGPAGEMTAALMQFLMPIVKVPTNIAREIFSYQAGVIPAATRIYKVGGIPKLTPEDADYVARELKKNGLGIIFLILGMIGAGSVGGYYQRGEKRKAGDVKIGEIRVGKTEIPHLILHHPLVMGPLEMGATVQRMIDNYAEFNSKHPEDMRKGSGVFEGIYTGSWETLKTIPFFDEPVRLGRALETPTGASKVASEMAESLVVPPDVRRISRALDKAGEEQIPREQKTFTQIMRGSIPGQRSKLPLDIHRLQTLTIDRLAEIIEKAPPGTFKGPQVAQVVHIFANKLKKESPELSEAERTKYSKILMDLGGKITEPPPMSPQKRTKIFQMEEKARKQASDIDAELKRREAR